MPLSKEDLQEIISSTVRTVLQEGRLVSEEQHHKDHEWAKVKREAEAGREKLYSHIKLVVVGAVTLSGVALLGKSLAWVGHLVLEAWRHGS